jgi:hypothetical protein
LAGGVHFPVIGCLDPGITIGRSHNLKRNSLHLFLDLIVVKPPTNQTLRGVKGVF